MVSESDSPTNMEQLPRPPVSSSSSLDHVSDQGFEGTKARDVEPRNTSNLRSDSPVLSRSNSASQEDLARFKASLLVADSDDSISPRVRPHSRSPSGDHLASKHAPPPPPRRESPIPSPKSSPLRAPPPPPPDIVAPTHEASPAHRRERKAAASLRSESPVLKRTSSANQDDLAFFKAHLATHPELVELGEPSKDEQDLQMREKKLDAEIAAYEISIANHAKASHPVSPKPANDTELIKAEIELLRREVKLEEDEAKLQRAIAAEVLEESPLDGSLSPRASTYHFRDVRSSSPDKLRTEVALLRAEVLIEKGNASAALNAESLATSSHSDAEDRDLRAQMEALKFKVLQESNRRAFDESMRSVQTSVSHQPPLLGHARRSSMEPHRAGSPSQDHAPRESGNIRSIKHARNFSVGSDPRVRSASPPLHEGHFRNLSEPPQAVEPQPSRAEGPARRNSQMGSVRAAILGEDQTQDKIDPRLEAASRSSVTHRRSMDGSKVGAVRAQILRDNEPEKVPQPAQSHRRATSLIDTRHSRLGSAQMVKDEVSHHWRAADAVPQPKQEEKVLKPAHRPSLEPMVVPETNHQDIPVRKPSRGFSLRGLFRTRSPEQSHSASSRHDSDDSHGSHSREPSNGSQSPRDLSPVRASPFPASFAPSSSTSSYSSPSSTSSSYSSSSYSSASSTSSYSSHSEAVRRESLLAHASALLRNQPKSSGSHEEVARAEQTVEELRTEVAREKELLRQLKKSD